MRALRSSTTLLAAAALLLASPALAVADEAGQDATPQTASGLGLEPGPTGLHVSTQGNRQVSLAWDVLPGATKYTVNRAVADNPGNIPNPALGTITYVDNNAKVAGLSNGVTYSFTVNATVGGKLTENSAPVSGAPIPGEVPSNLKLTEIGNGAAYLDFDASENATGYKAYIRVVDAHGNPSPLPGAASANVASSTITATKLSNGVTYGFTVAALVDGQYTDPSSEVLATPEAVPNKAGTPTAGTITPTSIQVKWAATAISGDATPVEKYTLSYKSAAAADWSTKSVGGSQLNTVVDGLTTGTEYSFKVAASNSLGMGPQSAVMKSTPSDKPGAVGNLTVARADAGTRVNLDWSAPKYAGGASITKYTVTVAPKAGAVTVNKVADSSAIVTGLDPAVNYKFTVTASTTSGTGAAAVIGSLAQAPAMQNVVMNADGSVTATFTPVSNPAFEYQAQAMQMDRLAAGAKGPGGKKLRGTQLSAVTTVTADNVTCSAGMCTAEWKKFLDDIDGETWTFQIRATDSINQYSNWSRLTPPPPAADSVNAVVATQDSNKNWSIKFTSWTDRSQVGVARMFVNGLETKNGDSGNLGRTPGDQTVALAGIGGSVTRVFNLPASLVYNDAVGGDVSEYTDAASGKHYRVHVFRSSWTFTVNDAPAPFEIFTLGGGGSSQVAQVNPERSGTGGGGGGGALKATNLKPGIYAVTVGGAGGTSSFPADSGTISASGGQVGTPGTGSGGDTNFTGGGGGGGRTRSEGNAEGWGGGNGFLVDLVTGTPVVYGGGGGGGGSQVSQPPTSVDGGRGGTGGGGQGGASFSYNPSSGISGLGSGGGGGGIYWTVTSSPASGGGSGLVAVRYEIEK